MSLFHKVLFTAECAESAEKERKRKKTPKGFSVSAALFALSAVK
jgi:hypothetical protein